MGHCCGKPSLSVVKKKFDVSCLRLEPSIERKRNPHPFIKQYRRLGKTFTANDFYSIYLVKCLSTHVVRVAKEYK